MMKSTKRAVGLMGVWFLSSWVWANGAGTSAGDFLSLGAGSRLSGMGSAGVALVDDATSLYWNPAAMVLVPEQSAVLMHTTYLESSAYSQGNYVKVLGKRGAFGVGTYYFSSGDLKQTDDSGSDTGNFTPNDRALSVGYARWLGPISVGVATKYVKSTIVKSASTFTLDLGAESQPLLNKRLRLAATAYNLGGKLKFDKEKEDLPREFRVGAAYKVAPQVQLVLDGAFPNSGKSYVASGAEYSQPFGGTWTMKARGGYSTRTSGDVSGLTGVTFGLGISRGPLGFDYALVPQGDLGTTHWMALVYR